MSAESGPKCNSAYLYFVLLDESSLITFPLGKDSSKSKINIISTQSSIARLLDRRDILLAAISEFSSREVSGV